MVSAIVFIALCSFFAVVDVGIVWNLWMEATGPWLIGLTLSEVRWDEGETKDSTVVERMAKAAKAAIRDGNGMDVMLNGFPSSVCCWMLIDGLR